MPGEYKDRRSDFASQTKDEGGSGRGGREVERERTELLWLLASEEDLSLLVDRELGEALEEGCLAVKGKAGYRGRRREEERMVSSSVSPPPATCEMGLTQTHCGP